MVVAAQSLDMLSATKQLELIFCGFGFLPGDILKT